MPVSNYVIRRYTPPTCTLEILAQSSALSRWMGKSVLKQLRFELHFDDPQLPEERRISIQGDRDQLESLCVAVTNYVQDFIEKPPEKFWATLEPQDSNISDDNEAKGIHTSSLQQINTLKSFSTQIQDSDIRLQPSGRMIHNLFLGNLASSASGSVIPLGLLQLFDLATALDDYSNDVVALPTLNNPTSTALPAWTPVAAVLVIGAAFLPMTLQYANHTQQQKTAKKLTPVQENIALSPSASPNLSTPLPALTPADTFLSSQPKPPLGTNVPLLGSNAVVPSALTSPGTTLLTKSPTSAKSFPPISQTPSNFTYPPTSQTPSNLTNPSSLPLTGKTLTIPKTPETTVPNLSIPSNTAALPKLPNPPVNIQSNTKKNGTKAIAQGDIPSPQTQSPLNTLSPTALSTSPDFSAVSPPVSALPNLSSGGGRNQLANFQSSSIATSSSSTDALVTRLRQSHKTTIATAPTNRSLVDATQLVEAKDYLKKHWQPPTQLKQSIEYSLVIGIDGSIERILPLGKTARDYVDRTGMPLIGERFVSPNKNGQAVRIRAVYSPDGKVQTFQESE
ncbi:MAG: DUF4335 domain-containing protein [Rhizonema sp. PD37]|nr:DUF4335 domain-containing protein [Rhizonema sp. PD37]